MGNYFSKNLKYLREKRHLSQNKLAEQVGVNQTTIARWETEEITPSINNVEQIASTLNISLPDLLIYDLQQENSIPKNEYDEQIEKFATENGIQVFIDKNAPLTANDVVEVNKKIMEIMQEQENKKNKESK